MFDQELERIKSKRSSEGGNQAVRTFETTLKNKSYQCVK